VAVEIENKMAKILFIVPPDITWGLVLFKNHLLGLHNFRWMRADTKLVV
jgi:hypothetical protein